MFILCCVEFLCSEGPQSCMMHQIGSHPPTLSHLLLSLDLHSLRFLLVHFHGQGSYKMSYQLCAALEKTLCQQQRKQQGLRNSALSSLVGAQTIPREWNDGRASTATPGVPSQNSDSSSTASSSDNERGGAVETQVCPSQALLDQRLSLPFVFL